MGAGLPPVRFEADAVLPEKVPHASPAVRLFARELGVDLSRVAGKVATAGDQQTVITGLNLVLFGVFDQVWGTAFADTIIGNDANNTFYGFRHQNGHFLAHDISGDFSVTLKFSAHYATLYDTYFRHQSADYHVTLDPASQVKP